MMVRLLVVNLVHQAQTFTGIQTYNAAQRGAVTTLTSSSNATRNRPSLNNFFTITLSEILLLVLRQMQLLESQVQSLLYKMVLEIVLVLFILTLNLLGVQTQH